LIEWKGLLCGDLLAAIKPAQLGLTGCIHVVVELEFALAEAAALLNELDDRVEPLARSG
jgi:hypothetical protein